MILFIIRCGNVAAILALDENLEKDFLTLLNTETSKQKIRYKHQKNRMSMEY